MEDGRARLRELPSVDEVLSRPAVRALERRVGRAAVKAAAQKAIAAARQRLLSGDAAAPGELVPDQDVLSRAEREAAPRLRRVINATGVVLHTNLGRAPLHPDAVQRVSEIAAGYSNLELDLDTGRRGHRSAAVEPLLCGLFGAEAAHVVNNCAGATLLALAALGRGAAAIVSRGELVEIGGGFRVPEILEQSGCALVEVGTTNRTRLSDYAAALDANPHALLLRVHRSNFALIGFTQEVTVADLSALGRERGALVLHDLGSGALELPEGIDESTAARSLADGADLVMVSGDKLLGGPQAGLLLGRREPLDLCRKHPLARALRADRMSIAALEATLQLYRSGRAGELPVNAALGARPSELSQRATRLALELSQRGVPCSVVENEGKVGGGSVPLARLSGYAVAIDGGPELIDELRRGTPPVVALLRDGRVLLDVRCVGDVGELAATASAAWSRTGGRTRPGARLEESHSGGEAPDGTEV
ncbi:MAG TPA: L-seryl-tRNA(Sec) selenium transferase [Myxococcales bacterium]|nr:L-seryl-tRNA(Sec) selenium transferase [Myxococcales bacterium]